MRTASSHFFGMPVTRWGWRSVWLGLAFVLLFISNVFVNVYIIRPDDSQMLMPPYVALVIVMLLCGLAAGVVGLLAVIRQREHSSLVWVSILLGLFVLLIVLNELNQGLQYMLSA